MKKLKFIFGFSFSFSFSLLMMPLATKAETLTPLPQVQKSQFQQGNSWNWTYYTQGDWNQPYSYEKYTVEQVNGSKVTMILSSRFSLTESYQMRQKFVVDIDQCHQAYANNNIPKRVHVQNFYYTGSGWEPIDLEGKSEIFEEKFNCNPHVYASSHHLFETQYQAANRMPWGSLELFRNAFKRTKRPASWFIGSSVNGQQLLGVAYQKEFSAGTPHAYTMRLEAISLQD